MEGVWGREDPWVYFQDNDTDKLGCCQPEFLTEPLVKKVGKEEGLGQYLHQCWCGGSSSSFISLIQSLWPK